MSRRVKVTTAADQDIRRAYEYLVQQSDNVASRFGQAIDRAFEKLAIQPLGGLIDSEHDELQGVRVWRLEPFRYLVFYRLVDKGIEVVRVLHASRDWLTILIADPKDVDER